MATSGGNVVLADTAGKPAAVVMPIQRYRQLLDELNSLRQQFQRHLTREGFAC